ncbi:hypothetical protein JAAARDRAFT_210749 [Jaapia argillacea MUCL 33604]|uniref:Protein kinase domain-containing protein n=1 Tax=Jaapia argillacea MUCL 33604 TaxID=933084 RepID=A0A067PAN0_9AGAM|nr:hypothetical protein JAAARDRAFT_210749 [Jaapia argillacea MUCL 33604]
MGGSARSMMIDDPLLLAQTMRVYIFSPYLKIQPIFSFKTTDDSIVEDLLALAVERYITLQPPRVEFQQLELAYSVLSSCIPIRPHETIRERVQEHEQNGLPFRPLSYDQLLAPLINCVQTELQLVLNVTSINPGEQGATPRRSYQNAPSHSFYAAAYLIAVKNARDAPSPSSVAISVEAFRIEQEEHPIYNGRPYNLRTSPIALYNSAFGLLKDVLSDLTTQPESHQVACTAKLFLAATNIYNSEWGRGDAVLRYVKTLLGIDLERTKEKDCKSELLTYPCLADDTSQGVYVYVEVKNELGIGGNSGLQGALAFLKHISQDEYEQIRNVSCCPCIVISIAGPYICVSGAVLVDVFIVQPFTDYIYLGGDPFMNERVTHVAKVFSAVSTAVRLLRQHYRDLSPNSIPNHDRLFPNPAYASDPPALPLKFLERFNYQGREVDDYRRYLFRAKFGDNIVVVKFCEDYSERAHRKLADSGLAPSLYYCSKIRGGIFMVIMELVESHDAHHQFIDQSLPQDVMNDVKDAIQQLHDIGLVFGDLRRTNIMVVRKDLPEVEAASRPNEDVGAGLSGNGKQAHPGGKEKAAGTGFRAMLVDFDWAGDHDQATYPAILNDSGEIDWADGQACGDNEEAARPGYDWEAQSKIVAGYIRDIRYSCELRCTVIDLCGTHRSMTIPHVRVRIHLAVSTWTATFPGP